MKILFCAYRDWALNACVTATQHFNHECFFLKDPKRLIALTNEHKFDIIILVGWSWKIPEEIVNSQLTVGIHPSDLPKFAGGSPIQHQIISGLKTSIATLFKLTENFDDGDIILKEQFSLHGSLKDVFNSLSKTTTSIIVKFINQHPHHCFEKQDKSNGFVCKRLKPEHSQLTITDLKCMTVSQLYDFIRCKEDPYPNAYFEDETGKLTIKLVEFEQK